ncbi:hypothetical protein C0J52_19006 [Blattella germanica]|nr:hypothetical protein C0J52_19006 [Blattella germanica]
MKCVNELIGCYSEITVPLQKTILETPRTAKVYQLATALSCFMQRMGRHHLSLHATLLIAFTELGKAAFSELQLAIYYRIEVVKKERDTHDMERDRIDCGLSLEPVPIKHREENSPVSDWRCQRILSDNF